MHWEDDEIEIPEPGPYFEKRMWAKVSAEMEAEQRRWKWRWLWLAAPAALVLAFFMGRATKEPEVIVAVNYVKAATVDHLERSQAVLLETVNASPTGARARAEELLATNRLLRRSAQTAGELRTAELLEELERILVEVARSSDELKPEEAVALRARIREQGLLLRVRLMEQTTRQEAEVAE